jgi:hypothetical protein
VFLEHVPFFERARIEEQLDALTRGELPLACWAAIRFSPPPRRAAERLSSSWRMMSCIRFTPLFLKQDRVIQKVQQRYFNTSVLQCFSV